MTKIKIISEKDRMKSNNFFRTFVIFPLKSSVVYHLFDRFLYNQIEKKGKKTKGMKSLAFSSCNYSVDNSHFSLDRNFQLKKFELFGRKKVKHARAISQCNGLLIDFFSRILN